MTQKGIADKTDDNTPIALFQEKGIESGALSGGSEFYADDPFNISSVQLPTDDCKSDN